MSLVNKFKFVWRQKRCCCHPHPRNSACWCSSRPH